jgi:hypothetical protein
MRTSKQVVTPAQEASAIELRKAGFRVGATSVRHQTLTMRRENTAPAIVTQDGKVSGYVNAAAFLNANQTLL